MTNGKNSTSNVGYTSGSWLQKAQAVVSGGTQNEGGSPNDAIWVDGPKDKPIPYKKPTIIVSRETLNSDFRKQQANNTQAHKTIVEALVNAGFLYPTSKNYLPSQTAAYNEAMTLYRDSKQKVTFSQWLSGLAGGGDSSSGGYAYGGGGYASGPTPEQLAAQRRQARAEVRKIAGTYGVDLSRKEVAKLTKIYINKQLSPTQLQNRIINRLEMDEDGNLSGQAGAVQDALDQWSANNGVQLSDDQVVKLAGQVIRGENDINGVVADLRKKYLASAYPAWTDRIEAGEDIADIAAPYMSVAQQLLEVDKVDLNDAVVKSSLQAVGDDGRPRVMPLYEFERKVRQDPRWQYTNNAKTTYANAANSIVRSFGLA